MSSTRWLLIQDRNALDRRRLRERLDVCPHVRQLLIRHDFRAKGRHPARRGIAHVGGESRNRELGLRQSQLLPPPLPCVAVALVAAVFKE